MTAPDVRTTGTAGRPPSPGGLGPDGTWSVEVDRADDAFEALAAEWTDLYERSSSATPFQSYGWLAAWWRSYGTPGDLRIVQVRRSGRLMAVLPLVRRRRYGHRVLVPAGDGLSDHVDLLADDEHADEALPLLAGELVRLGGVAAIDLNEVRPGAAAWRLAEHWPAAWRRYPSSPCMQAPAAPFGEHLMKVSKNRRRKYRRAVSKAEAEGLTVREVPAAEAAEGVATMLRLHERQWRGRNITPEHLRPRFARFLETAMATMVADGQAAISEYRIGDEAIAVSLMVLGHGLAGGYLYGVDPATRRRIDFSPLLIARTFELAAQHGAEVASLLRGVEPHKEAWGLEQVFNERLVLGGRNRIRSAAYGALVRGRVTAAATVKHHLPRLYPLLDRLRRLGRRSGGTNGEHREHREQGANGAPGGESDAG